MDYQVLDPPVSRRQFLRRLTMAAGAASLLPLAASAQTPPAPPAGKFVPVGKVADFKPGEYRRVALPSGPGAYVRREPGRAGKFVALSAACTHKGCPVLWTPTDNQFKCPCHGGRFDENGKNIAGPPPAPLASLPVKVEHGQVLVQA